MSAIERVLIGAGLGALAPVAVSRVDSAAGERKAREELAVRVAVAPPDTTEWSETRRSAWQESLRSGPGTALGLLSIASIGLSVPLLEGTDDVTLNRGVGRVGGHTRRDEPRHLGPPRRLLPRTPQHCPG